MSLEASRCGRCQATLFQCVACRDLDDAIRRSLKQKRKSAPVSAASSEKEKQDRFRARILQQFELQTVSRDGHCLFSSFATGWEKLTKVTLTVQSVRKTVAQSLLDSKGQIPGHYQYFEELPDGCIVLTDYLQKVRQSKSKAAVKNPTKTTLEAYAESIENQCLYGGDLEVSVLAHVFDVAIHVYSWHYFDGRSQFAPQIYGNGQRVISLLFEQDFGSRSGGRDHYDLIIDKFKKWRKYMLAMPVWNQDIGLCNGLGGRGIKALRAFKSGDVITFYDGHRVDKSGKVLIPRESVSELYADFGVEPDDIPFRKTHAVSLGRVHVTGLMIDGYPMTLPVFDDVSDLKIGRGALANSANPHDSNMKMVWVEAPDLPRDIINNLENCEAFLIARRDIKAGEELLWHYKLHKEVRVRLAGSIHDLDTTASDVEFEDGVSGWPSPRSKVFSIPDEVAKLTSDEIHAVIKHHEPDVPIPRYQLISANQSDNEHSTLHVGDKAEGDVIGSEDADSFTGGPLNLPSAVIVADSVLDESENSDLEESHAPGSDFKVGDSCVVMWQDNCKTNATVTGRIVSHSRRRIQKYVVDTGRNEPLVVRCCDVQVPPDAISMNSSDEEPVGASAVDEQMIAVGDVHVDVAPFSTKHVESSMNESGNLANELAGRFVSVYVGKM
jgi:hypothetical protein